MPKPRKKIKSSSWTSQPNQEISTIDKEINDFLTEWDSPTFARFLRDVVPIVELYGVDDEGHITIDGQIQGDQKHIDTVVMVRTCYLVSRFIDFHTPKLLSMRTSFKGLWKRLEEESEKLSEEEHESL